MEFAFVLLVAYAVSGVTEIDNGPVKSELHDVFDEFCDLVPAGKEFAIFTKYLATDPEMEEAMLFFVSDGFKKLVTKIESIKDVKDFYDYLQEAGVNVYAFVNYVHAVLHFPPMVTGKTSPRIKITGGLAGFWLDTKAALPIDKIKALYHEKLATSPAFAEVVYRFTSPRFQELMNTLRSDPEFLKVLHLLEKAGVINRSERHDIH